MGLLTDRIMNKLKKSNLINEHAQNREPVLYTYIVSKETAYESRQATNTKTTVLQFLSGASCPCTILCSVGKL